jgi:hypothetical protein
MPGLDALVLDGLGLDMLGLDVLGLDMLGILTAESLTWRAVLGTPRSRVGKRANSTAWSRFPKAISASNTPCGFRTDRNSHDPRPARDVFCEVVEGDAPLPAGSLASISGSGEFMLTRGVKRAEWQHDPIHNKKLGDAVEHSAQEINYVSRSGSPRAAFATVVGLTTRDWRDRQKRILPPSCTLRLPGPWLNAPPAARLLPPPGA